LSFLNKLRNKRAGDGTLTTIVIIVVVLVVLGFFGWFGLHL
jgi:hypothetical protein